MSPEIDCSTLNHRQEKTEMATNEKRGPVIPWDFQPPPKSPKDGDARQEMKLVMHQSPPESQVTAIPSSRRRGVYKDLGNGGYLTLRKPGAE